MFVCVCTAVTWALNATNNIHHAFYSRLCGISIVTVTYPVANGLNFFLVLELSSMRQEEAKDTDLRRYADKVVSRFATETMFSKALTM